MPAEEEKLAPTSPFSCHEEEEEEEEEEEGNPTWAQNLSGSEKWRFQLARAFLHDPHVLVVHRPVDELDSNLKELFLSLFREFVDKKGLEMDETNDLDMSKRRPRTLIFSTGSSTSTNIPDIIWRIGENGVTVERNRPAGRGPQQLRVVHEFHEPALKLELDGPALGFELLAMRGLGFAIIHWASQGEIYSFSFFIGGENSAMNERFAQEIDSRSAAVEDANVKILW
eukprot:s1116_g12.t1